MIDGPSARNALLVTLLLLAPTALSAAPEKLMNPTTVDSQEITGLAMEPSGRYFMAVVQVDAANVGGGLGLPGVGDSKKDLVSCNLGAPGTQGQAQCTFANQKSTPTNTERLQQTVAATSFPSTGGGVTARYAVGGPGNRISFWSSTEGTSRLDGRVPVEEPVLNVSITPNGTRMAAATDAPSLSGGSTLFVYDTTVAGPSPRYVWEFNLTDSEGQRAGVRVRDMEHSRFGRYLAIGTTPSSGSSNGGVLFLDIQDDNRPRDPRGKASVWGTVNDLELSDDGNAMVVGTSNILYFFPLPAGLPSRDFLPWSAPVSGGGASHVAISGDGWHFAAANGDRIHFYRRVDTSSIAQQVGSVDGYKTGAPVSDLAYDRTGRLLVAVAGNTVYGFAANRTEPIWTFDATQAAGGSIDGPLRKVEVSDHAQRIVVAGRTQVMAYDTRVAATLQPVGETRLNAIPGSTVRLSFRATNTGSLEDVFEFTPLAPPGWPDVQGPGSLRLRPGESEVVTVNVTVPEGHQPATQRFSLKAYGLSLRNATLEGRAAQDPLVATADVDLVIPRSVALAIEPAEERFSIAKGGEKALPVTIRNTGNAGGVVNLSFDQALSRGSTWIVRWERDQLNLAAGAEETVNLVLDAPGDGASGDKNTLTLVAREGTYEVRRAITAYIDAEFGAEVTADNDTLEFRSRAPQVISVSIRNTGNTDDVYNLTHAVSSAAVNDWTVQLSRDTIEVPRGQTRNVGVTITPNVAEPRAATLTIRAVSQGSLQQDEGSVPISLSYREPDRLEEDDNMIPAPSPIFALAALALAGLAARRRLRGGAP